MTEPRRCRSCNGDISEYASTDVLCAWCDSTDGTAPTDEYEVLVANVFNANNPHDAVMQMAAWITDYGYQAGYRVRNITTNTEYFIDAEDGTILEATS